MVHKSVSVFLFAVLGALSACSGGGGGGGDEAAGTRGVRVLHGAIEATPVDLIVDAATSAHTIKYGEAGGYYELGEGQHLFQLSESKGTPGTLFSRSVTNSGGQKFTLLFYGDRGTFGLRTTLLTESAPEVASGTGLIRVIDGAVGAASLTLSIGGVSTVANFGGASTYQDLAPAIYPYIIRRTSDGAVVAQGSVLIEEGKAYSIFIGGEVGYFITSKVLDE